MKHRGLLLASGGSRARNVARAICSIGVVLKVTSEPDNIDDKLARESDFIVVDASDDEAGIRLRKAYLELARSPLKNKAILFSDLNDREAFIELLEADMFRHVIASGIPGALGRLSICLAKLLGGKIFGMSKYVPWGTQIHEVKFSRSSGKQEIIRSVAEFCELMVIPKRLASLAGTVADEFVMNALFDAPMDRSGRPLFADRDRTDDVKLPHPHQARFRYCCTGDSLVLSIFDSYGSLDEATVRSNLLRTLSGGRDQIRQVGAGAGMGLFMAFKALSDWIVNIQPGRGTEMIGVIHTSGTYRDHIAMPKSFNVFIAD